MNAAALEKETTKKQGLPVLQQKYFIFLTKLEEEPWDNICIQLETLDTFTHSAGSSQSQNAAMLNV